MVVVHLGGDLAGIGAQYPAGVLDQAALERDGRSRRHRRAARASAPPKVLLLTTYATEADILAALDAGATGYLLKDAPPDDLYRGIRAVARGETVLASEVASLLVRRARSPEPTLTEREMQILELLADGLANKEMARRLLVSEATVKSHLSQVIYTKFGVDTRAGAVAKAIEQRIIRA